MHIWVVIREEVFDEKEPYNSSMSSTTKDSVLASPSAQTRNGNNEPPNSATDSASSLPNASVESTYYNCSNSDIGSTEQELINIFEHKVYTFYTFKSIFNPPITFCYLIYCGAT